MLTREQRRKRGRSSQPRLERALSILVPKASRSPAKSKYEHSYHERLMIPHYGSGLRGAGHRTVHEMACTTRLRNTGRNLNDYTKVRVPLALLLYPLSCCYSAKGSMRSIISSNFSRTSRWTACHNSGRERFFLSPLTLNSQ